MSRVVLDTDILSEILKRRDPVVLSKAIAYAAEHRFFTFTAVSIHEITFGLVSKGATSQLREARAVFVENEVLLPTAEDYDLSGQIRGFARQQGRQLAIDDCLVAVVAARHTLPVVTGNTAHFEAMRQVGLPLQIQNWRTP